MNLKIEKTVEIARRAGEEIMKIYDSNDFEIETKADDSPLTRADKASNEIIAGALLEEYPDIPIISEEDKQIPYNVRKNWKYFWLVDPLDGTKEFIKRNGEFTVNIALIENLIPIGGVVCAPALDQTYFALPGEGAYKQKGDGPAVRIGVNQNFADGLVAVQSRSHSKPEEDEFYSQFNIIHREKIGSSLKFCLIAEAKADAYFRSGPTMEWDTAAGQAILEAAGGVTLDGSNPFLYNKPSLLNPGFLCLASKDILNLKKKRKRRK